MFLTIGNGYEWYEGELVYNSEEDADYIRYLESLFVNGKAFQHDKWTLRDEYLHNPVIADSYKNHTRLSYTTENRVWDILSTPDDVYYEIPERRCRWSIYLSGYSRFMAINNIPDDIKPDWKAGVEEVIAMLKEDGYDMITPIDVQGNREKYFAEYKQRVNKRLTVTVSDEDIAAYIKAGKPLFIEED